MKVLLLDNSWMLPEARNLYPVLKIYRVSKVDNFFGPGARKLYRKKDRFVVLHKRIFDNPERVMIIKNENSKNNQSRLN